MSTRHSTPMPARGDLVNLINELSGLGLEHGADSVIAELSPGLLHEADATGPDRVAGETIVKAFGEDGTRVLYRGMGRDPDVTGPVDVDTARRAFREGVC